MAKKRSKKQQQEYRSKLLGIVAAVLCVIASLILGQDRVDEILDTLFQETGMTSAPVQVDGELKVPMSYSKPGAASLRGMSFSAIISNKDS